jgi:hypothetical protein
MDVALGVAALISAVSSAPLGMRAGEAFTFRFSVGPIESGRARLSVGAPARDRDGRRLVAVQGQAESAPWLRLFAPLDDRYRVILDADALTPREIVSEEHGVRERTTTTTLDGAARAMTFHQETRAKGVAAPQIRDERRRFGGPVRDPLAGLFALRAAPLVDGERIEQLLLDGPILWRATLEVKRGARLRLESDGDGAQSRRAIRIDGVLARADDGGRVIGRPERRFTIYLSDDDARLLLRLEADTDLGRCALELTSYSDGKRAPQARSL